MGKSFLKHIAFLILLLGATIGRTQNYPVQSFVTITPPYSSYLPDYADPFNNQMKILLTLTDFAVPSYQVKLRFNIQGQGYSIQSANLTNIPPITITPGVPVEVSGSMLAPYLSTDNLVFDGINVAQYEISKILPEGPATVCIEVIDFNSANQAVLSNPSCGQTWFALYDPPLAVNPFCGTEVTPTDPQQVMFSWSPLHMANPTNGMTQYEFELFRIIPEGADPNQVMNSSIPWYTETTTNTFVNYGVLQSGSPLEVGMSYAWRVKAIDASGRALFKNNGYSAVCTFTYGNAAAEFLEGVTLELNSEGTGQNVGAAWWNGSSMFDEYILEVRKTSNPDYNWHRTVAQDIEEKMYMLEPSTEYECRVKGVVSGAETDWSNTSVFTTKPERNYECGSTALPGKPSTIQPLNSLLGGMKVQTGQFVMEITAAEPADNGQPGRFKGTGRIPITFMMTANVEFDDILIDENLIHHDGRINVMTRPLDEWINTQENIYVDGVITNYTSNPADSTVIVTLDDGSNLTFDWPPPGETTTIIDDSGLIYTIDDEGNVTVVQSTVADNDNLFATKEHQIVFKEHPNQVYGFDELKYAEWTTHYPAITLSDDTKYFVTYKSLRINASDKIYARIRSNQEFTPKFRTDSGVLLVSNEIDDSTYEITVDNFATAQIIYAFDDDSMKIGKCNLSVYEDKHHEVVVVPVNGATAPNQATLESDLNNIFSQASASFDITVAPNFDVAFDLNNNGLDGANDTTLSLYSDEMKAIRSAYFDANNKENKLYLFVVPDIQGDLAGYMVRGKIVGFVEQGQPARTYAHELGHGAFGLEHTFPHIAQGQTNNILDYSAGTHLTHDQWYEIQHFSLTWSILDDEEDGAVFGAAGTYVRPICDPYVLAQVNTYSVFYDPVGGIVDLSKAPGAQANRFYTDLEEDPTARGSLEGFIYNGQQYVVKFDNNLQNPFLGYFLKTESTQTGTPLEITADPSVDTSMATKVIMECSMNEIRFPGDSRILSFDCDECFPQFSETFFSENHSETVDAYLSSNNTELHSSLHSDQTLISDLSQKVNSGQYPGFLDEKQEDRIFAFNDFNSGRRFVVVAISQNMISRNEDHWHELAKKVYLQSNLTDADVLITVPYKEFTFGNVDYVYTMPGLHFGQNAELNTSEISIAKFDNVIPKSDWLNDNGPEIIRQFIDKVFKNTEKRVVVFEGILHPNYSVNINVYDDIISGYQQNCYIKLYKNTVFSDVEVLIQNHKDDVESMSGNPNIQPGPETAKVLGMMKATKRSQLFDLLEDADPFSFQEFTPPEADKFSFKDQYIVQNLEETKDYIYKRAFKKYSNYLDVFEVSHTDASYSEPANEYTWNREAYGWQVLDNVVYTSLDVTGVFLGFVGLDVVTDGLGFVYSSCRGNTEMSATYASTVFLIGVSGGTVNLSKNVINSGVKHILRKEGGSYIVETVDVVVNRVRFQYKVHPDVSDADVLRLQSYIDAGKMDDASQYSFIGKQNDKAGQIQILDDIAAEISSLLSFIDDLPWNNSLKNKLRNEINERPGLLTLFDVEDIQLQKDLAGSWKALDESSVIPEVIAKDPDAILAVKNSMDEGLDGIDAIEDAIEVSNSPNLTWQDILARFQRGNDFNRKAVDEKWYPYNEVHLANGKRLDSYKPPKNGAPGEIVSRKATNLNDIQLSTFESYLDEMIAKYSPGTTINSPKYAGTEIEGTVLQGQMYLEIPASNQNLNNIQDYIDLANNKGITLRFKPE